MLKIFNSCKKINYLSRNISLCKIALDKEKNSKRKVKATVELVMLVDHNDKILGLKPKTESELLARKSNFILERVTDPKYGKTYPAYKMVSSSQKMQVEKKASTAKVLKKIPLNCRINDNDLTVKIQTVRKWLAKNCEVHVAVMKNNESHALMKNVFTKIQDELKNECRTLNIRNNEDSIKFILLPPKETPKVQSPPIKEEKEKTDMETAKVNTPNNKEDGKTDLETTIVETPNIEEDKEKTDLEGKNC